MKPSIVSFSSPVARYPGGGEARATAARYCFGEMPASGATSRAMSRFA